MAPRVAGFLALLLACTVGCPGPSSSDGDGDADIDGEADGDADGDTDADAEEDGDAGPESNIGDVLAGVEPEPSATARRNVTVHIDFLEPVDPDTLVVEIGGEPVRVSTLDDQTFRFVPFPLFDSGEEVVVTVAAGLETDSGIVLDADYTWSFLTDDSNLDETGDPALAADEAAHIMAGAEDEPMELVTDWEDPESSLYEISPPLDPSSPEAQRLVARMMVSVVYHGGIGLAAPQVGVSRRLFVADVGDGFEAFIDPVILDYSEEMGSMTEGCLSVPDLPLRVFRPTWVEVSYVQADGTVVDLRRIENPPDSIWTYPATVFQHEYDHLNGILIPERASER